MVLTLSLRQITLFFSKNTRKCVNCVISVGKSGIKISILRTKYILRTYSFHTTGLFIPSMNDSPYDWVPVRMIPRKNDSILRIYLRSSSVNKLMTWSGIDYLSSLRADDLFPDRISILLTNGWPLSERMTCSQTEYLFSVWTTTSSHEQ